ncbi:MAG: hypothetical protein RIC35_07960 [Marinoscillum sp.]
MESHNKLLSILHIVYGSIQIFFFVIVHLLMDSILPFVLEELDPGSEELMIVEMVFMFVRSLFLILIIVFPLPSIIGGLGLMNGKKWGMTLVMISGCLSLLSVPIGTALGIYTIWVYLENNKAKNDANKE